MILFILYVLLSSLGLILFKLGSQNLNVLYENSIFSLSISTTMFTGILCYLASFFLWMFIVNKAELSFIYPLSIACINITILIGSYFILKEPITLKSIVGAAIIILGIIIMKQ